MLLVIGDFNAKVGRREPSAMSDHQLLVATLKVRLGERQRQNSIPPLNLEELKKVIAV